ncbi:MAG: type II toxin-antitoxin system RelE/ParE family toxin [Candidatus Sabulitectum sp.]|nr:type II toxin-antitoxin system RelE/ParE family toxin [Candidatus Sabulitectum sp.]
MRIRFAPSARTQFLAGISYIRRDNPETATEFRISAENSLGRLIGFPKPGRNIPEFPYLPHRELLVKPYRFFYRKVDKTIWIVAVWHCAQLPYKPLWIASS